MQAISLRSFEKAPKPVPTRPIIHHGLFAVNFVKQHMMVDKHWVPSSISEQFFRMAQLLRKRLQFYNLQKETMKAKILKRYHILKYQTRVGRLIYKRTLYEDSSTRVRNMLIDHKQLQRLFHGMSLHQVVENMNERTFTKRKERDRLLARLEVLKEKYTKLLMQRSEVENHIKYVDDIREYVCDKENRFRKLLADSSTRLTAIKTINTTYKKIIQILRCDAIFYEPILKSLDDDIMDQELFIKNILYMSIPAMHKYREATYEYHLKEDAARKSLQLFRETMAAPNGRGRRRRSSAFSRRRSRSETPKQKRFNLYVRETGSMLAIKYRLKTVEETIKKVKIATLRSQALSLYPEIKNQMESNKHLRKVIESDMLGLEAYEAKQKCAAVVKEYLKNNIDEEEASRLNVIQSLKDGIKREDDFMEGILKYIKNRSNLFVLIRYSLWNIHDILRYVMPTRAQYPKYPNDYLKLPLLKFETLNMCAVAPDPYEEDVIRLLKIAKDKMKILMKHFKTTKASRVETNRNIYESTIRDAMDYDVPTMEEPEMIKDLNYELEHSKMHTEVPNRKQIKINSAKLVEESLKTLDD